MPTIPLINKKYIHMRDFPLRISEGVLSRKQHDLVSNYGYCLSALLSGELPPSVPIEVLSDTSGMMRYMNKLSRLVIE